jgi:hypothetical protein
MIMERDLPTQTLCNSKLSMIDYEIRCRWRLNGVGVQGDYQSGTVANAPEAVDLGSLWEIGPYNIPSGPPLMRKLIQGRAKGIIQKSEWVKLMVDEGLPGKDGIRLVPRDEVDARCRARGCENCLNRRPARASNAKLDA